MKADHANLHSKFKVCFQRTIGISIDIGCSFKGTDLDNNKAIYPAFIVYSWVISKNIQVSMLSFIALILCFQYIGLFRI